MKCPVAITLSALADAAVWLLITLPDAIPHLRGIGATLLFDQKYLQENWINQPQETCAASEGCGGHWKLGSQEERILGLSALTREPEDGGRA